MEATPLSAHEETETQTPISVEGDMNGLDEELIVHAIYVGGYAIFDRPAACT